MAPYALWPGHEGQCGAEDTPLGYVSFAGEEDAPVDKDTCLAILETVTYPIVFVDTTHTVRYLNKAARRRYYEQRGVPNLEGKSIFDCHQAATKAQMLQLFERMRGGEDEIYLKVNKYNEKVFVVAVRKQDGELLGYYERFECVQ